MRPATVSKWRTRFAAHRVSGLEDEARPGAPVRYGPVTEDRILALLDEAPPRGYARWNGRLVAEKLGDVSPSQVWRVLRQQQIQLERRRSWCVSMVREYGPGVRAEGREHHRALSPSAGERHRVVGR